MNRAQKRSEERKRHTFSFSLTLFPFCSLASMHRRLHPYTLRNSLPLHRFLSFVRSLVLAFLLSSSRCFSPCTLCLFVPFFLAPFAWDHSWFRSHPEDSSERRASLRPRSSESLKRPVESALLESGSTPANPRSDSARLPEIPRLRSSTTLPLFPTPCMRILLSLCFLTLFHPLPRLVSSPSLDRPAPPRLHRFLHRASLLFAPTLSSPFSASPLALRRTHRSIALFLRRLCVFPRRHLFFLFFFLTPFFLCPPAARFRFFSHAGPFFCNTRARSIELSAATRLSLPGCAASARRMGRTLPLCSTPAAQKGGHAVGDCKDAETR